MSDEARRRTFDTFTGYFRVYWPLFVTMILAISGYAKVVYLVENIVSRVTKLEHADDAKGLSIQKIETERLNQNGTIMVIDERTRRMADDIKELRNDKRRER
jgi:hypothetical protein